MSGPLDASDEQWNAAAALVGATSGEDLRQRYEVSVAIHRWGLRYDVNPSPSVRDLHVAEWMVDVLAESEAL